MTWSGLSPLWALRHKDVSTKHLIFRSAYQLWHWNLGGLVDGPSFVAPLYPEPMGHKELVLSQNCWLYLTSVRPSQVEVFFSSEWYKALNFMDVPTAYSAKTFLILFIFKCKYVRNSWTYEPAICTGSRIWRRMASSSNLPLLQLWVVWGLLVCCPKVNHKASGPRCVDQILPDLQTIPGQTYQQWCLHSSRVLQSSYWRY